MATNNIEEKNIMAEQAPAAEKENAADAKNIVKLPRTYQFEGKEYKEIDMSGLDKLTIKDAIDTQRSLFGEQEVRPPYCAKPPPLLPAALRQRRPAFRWSFLN